MPTGLAVLRPRLVGFLTAVSEFDWRLQKKSDLNVARYPPSGGLVLGSAVTKKRVFMTYDYLADTRIDPRIARLLAAVPEGGSRDVLSYEEFVGAANSPKNIAFQEARRRFMDRIDTEEVASSVGLDITYHELISQPDGNTVNVQVYRPKGDEVVPCVYYIHGGGMMFLSAHDGNYKAWFRTIANCGVAVVAIDFRNAVSPSSVPEVAPFPAGLNDCVSGCRWVVENAERFGIDPNRVVISGESGGGNLTIATTMSFLRSGEVSLIKGVYALCPYIAGFHPREDLPSSIRNNGISLQLHNNNGVVGYGEEAYREKNALAWPLFASVEDVAGFPPSVIQVDECDPLRDEGVAFYRLLLEAGATVRCVELLGMTHAGELMIWAVPEITRATAAAIANFAAN